MDDDDSYLDYEYGLNYMKDICLSLNPSLLNPNIKVKEARKIIKDLAYVSEKNQIYTISFGVNILDSDKENPFWDYANLKVYNVTKYKVKIKRNFYEKEIFLNFNKKIEELKQIIFEATKVPKERQIFYLNNKILKNDEILKNVNLLENKLDIEISKQSNDIIYLKYPNSEVKEIKTDLYNTGIELLEQIQGNSIEKPNDIKYDLFHNDKKLFLGEFLINLGIKSGDTLNVSKRSPFPINIKTLSGKNITLDAEPSDSIEYIKFLIWILQGIPGEFLKIIFKGQQLEDNKTIADYNILKDSTIHLVLRLLGGK